MVVPVSVGLARTWPTRDTVHLLRAKLDLEGHLPTASTNFSMTVRNFHKSKRNEKYSRSFECRFNPFSILFPGSVMSLGCWADLQDRAFRRLEKIDPLLQDTFVNRANPIGVCAKVAKKHNSNTFALQKGGQCFIGKEGTPTYERYGPSRKCKYGLGGQMANDVYFLRSKYCDSVMLLFFYTYL